MSGRERVTAAMVLCAGLGTRLRPLTDRLAKPMVPVGDRPAVAHVLAQVRLAVPSRVVVNSHHRSEDLRAWAERENVPVSHERELLGTAGGVKRAEKLLGGGDVLVWNGDIASNLDPRALVEAHARGPSDPASDGAMPATSDPLATLAVHLRAKGEGNVGVGEDGRIVRLRSSCFGDEVQGADFIAVHVIGPELRARLPETGCLVGDVYIPALARGDVLRAFVTDAAFTDIGSIAEYLAANAAWLRSRGATSWAHPSAKVSASIEGSVIGANAVIEAPATACVVWAGARVDTARHAEVVLPALEGA